MIKDKVREMLESIVPQVERAVPTAVTANNYGIDYPEDVHVYRARVIDALAEGARWQHENASEVELFERLKGKLSLRDKQLELAKLAFESATMFSQCIMTRVELKRTLAEIELMETDHAT